MSDETGGYAAVLEGASGWDSAVDEANASMRLDERAKIGVESELGCLIEYRKAKSRATSNTTKALESLPSVAASADAVETTAKREFAWTSLAYGMEMRFEISPVCRE